jgi:N-acetylglutamate synthase-like GNAT family acetyltransferase
MKIRKATKKDEKEVIRIAKDLKEWFTKKAIESMKVDFKLNNLVVAIDKDKVAGFLCYTSYDGRMQLIWMGVKKDIRRKGIGEFLLEWLEKESRKFKLHTIELETLPDEVDYKPYEQTRAFYYKNGFKRTLYKKATISGWDDQIILEKML